MNNLAMVEYLLKRLLHAEKSYTETRDPMAMDRWMGAMNEIIGIIEDYFGMILVLGKCKINAKGESIWIVS